MEKVWFQSNHRKSLLRKLFKIACLSQDFFWSSNLIWCSEKLNFVTSKYFQNYRILGFLLPETMRNSKLCMLHAFVILVCTCFLPRVRQGCNTPCNHKVTGKVLEPKTTLLADWMNYGKHHILCWDPIINVSGYTCKWRRSSTAIKQQSIFLFCISWRYGS